MGLQALEDYLWSGARMADMISLGACSASAQRLALIRLCQDAGFTLREIGQLLAVGSRRRTEWDRLAEGKLAELDARIAGAHAAKELVEHALNCPSPDPLDCPKFRAAVSARLEPHASLAGSGSVSS